MAKASAGNRQELVWAAASALVFGFFFWIARSLEATPVLGPESRGAIWEEIRRASRHAGLDPGFVYAICRAESGLNPKASNQGKANGLMQLQRSAWDEVSKRPYSEVFDPAANIEVGVAYLAHLKAFLEKNEAFSYPNLAASYRYGPYALKRVDFDLDRLPRPANHVYQQLFAGAAPPAPPAPPLDAH